MRFDFDLSLYLVTDRPLSRGRDIGWIVEEAVRGGVTMVQLREKEATDEEFVRLAKQLVEQLRPLGIPLIINDNIEVALLSDADGVHIGQSDVDYVSARRLVGDDKIIGLSVETMEQVVEANELDVDYIGISPVYATPTKTDTFTPFGLDGLQRAVSLTSHPSVAIGGMNLQTVEDVMRSGVDGVAVVSAIVSADSPFQAAQELSIAVEASKPTWSSVAWSASQQMYDKLKAQPFNRGLMLGDLPQDVFKKYLQQDELYINNYAEEMLLVADMLPDSDMKLLFRQFAEEGMEAERALHSLMADEFGAHSAVEPSTVTAKYISHTRQYVDSRNLPLSVAAILPCLWVYNELGRYMAEHCVDNSNPYKEWIETYSSPLMNRGIEQTIALCDTIAESASARTRVDMRRAFMRSVELEYDFFDYPFRELKS